MLFNLLDRLALHLMSSQRFDKPLRSYGKVTVTYWLASSKSVNIISEELTHDNTVSDNLLLPRPLHHQNKYTLIHMPELKININSGRLARLPTSSYSADIRNIALK